MPPKHQGIDIDAYLRDRVVPMIDRFGWMIQGVFPTADDPDSIVPFAYTIGLAAHGIPELVVSGLPGDAAGAILNHVAPKHRDRALKAGDTVDVGGQDTLHVLDAPLAEIQQARNLYGDHVTALQLVWADDTGSYPWQDSWTLPDAQPLYLPAEGHHADNPALHDELKAAEARLVANGAPPQPDASPAHRRGPAEVV